MRVVYIEPFSGISGDMLVGALLDLGMDIAELRIQLSLLPLEGYTITARRTSRAGIQATKFDVDCPQEPGHSEAKHGAHARHPGRTLREIRRMIETSELSSWVKEKSVEAFTRLAEAEGKIHDRPADQVHFHEVGAVDSIIDIVGSMIVFERLLPARVVSSAANLGQGTVNCQHGIYPVPGPATQEILKDVPTYSNSITGELTTPTGAALLKALVHEFGPRPLMKIRAAGYGAGGRDLPGSANVLRITVGDQISGDQTASPDEQVAVVEATIDDMNPQVYGYFQERAIAEGALDVYATPIQMKKNRPAVQLTMVCAQSDLDRLARLIFAETTTIGIRYTLAQRITLQRDLTRVKTEYGEVTIKVSWLDGQRINFAPEYEDCRRLAQEKGVALKEVQAAATRAYLETLSS